MRSALIAALLPPLSAGHGFMTSPPSRNSGNNTAGDPDNGLWFNQGCQPGCSKCAEGQEAFGNKPCSTPMDPTVTDPQFRTYTKVAPGLDVDLTQHMPWRSPGHAPVKSPCGIAGGGSTYHPSNGAMPPPGFANGFDGRDLPAVPGARTEWARGSVQEVAWMIVANHGGGYAYRLCPKSRSVTEECFQRHHLQFASEQSWIQYMGKPESNRTSLTAATVSEGTSPIGSQWRRCPVPACGDATGGVGRGDDCTTPPQFEPPVPGLYGYGSAACSVGGQGKCSPAVAKYWLERFNFSIVDQVHVPADIPAGEYMLSFRWDTEQTAQIWAECADVTITA